MNKIPDQACFDTSQVSPVLQTQRLILRPLQPSDATQIYLDWFSDSTVQRFIAAASERQSLDSLRMFIDRHLSDPASLLLGIFDRGSGLHIGNIKYEPIDFAMGRAIVGILIGSTEWRGRAVFSEAFDVSSAWLCSCMGIREYWLGVERENTIAIRGYRRAGFAEAPAPEDLFGKIRLNCLYMFKTVDVR